MKTSEKDEMLESQLQPHYRSCRLPTRLVYKRRTVHESAGVYSRLMHSRYRDGSGVPFRYFEWVPWSRRTRFLLQTPLETIAMPALPGGHPHFFASKSDGSVETLPDH